MNDYLELHSLYHHGIKGQKHGTRRFQNEDGSLTPEGKERYRTISRRADTAKEAGKATKDMVESAAKLPVKAGRIKRNSYSDLSDAELQKRVNRLNLEQRYSDLTGETKYVKSGSEVAREFLQTVGTVLAIGISAATLAKLVSDSKLNNVRRKK